MVTGAKGLAAEYPWNPKPIYLCSEFLRTTKGYRETESTNQPTEYANMFTIKEIPYTVESNAFVIMFYDQECDYSGVFETREDAEFAMEMYQNDLDR